MHTAKQIAQIFSFAEQPIGLLTAKRRSSAFRCENKLLHFFHRDFQKKMSLPATADQSNYEHCLNLTLVLGQTIL